MGNRYGMRSGTITAQNIKCKGDLTINDDIIFSDVSAGALGVTGGIDLTGTTSAIGIDMTGATISGDDIALSTTGVINAVTSITQEIGGTAKLALTTGALTLSNAVNVAVNTATGTKIGTAVGQKLGFWNVAPVVQPASADQADQGSMTASAVGDLGSTNSSPWGYGSEANADAVHTEIDKLVADVAALDTLLTAVRTALVNAGLMKGSA